MQKVRISHNWLQRIIRRYGGSFLNPKLPPDTIPRFTTERWVQEIDIALINLRDEYRGSFYYSWCRMYADERTAWVQRRKASLMIIWVRGGSEGLQGLPEGLCEALGDIDH